MKQKKFHNVIDWSTSSLWMLAALSLHFLSGCGAESVPLNGVMEDGRPVRVAQVRAHEPVTNLRLAGETRAAERSQVASLSSGYLAERRVVRGEAVRAGQLLAVLDNPDLAPAAAAADARVREMEARVAQAGKEAERFADLHRRDLVATNDFDRVQAERDAAVQVLDQARADLLRTRRQLDQAHLKAPVDGIVAELLAEPGDFVAAGQPVLTLQGSGALEVAVALPERAAAALRAGDTVRVSLFQSGEVVPGRLREIGRAGRHAPAPAVIDLDAAAAAHWRPGQAVYVYVEWSEPAALAVPLVSLSDPGSGRARVFQIDNGYARAVNVETGPLRDGWVEVRGALEPNDLVVTAGQASLVDNQKVRVLP